MTYTSMPKCSVCGNYCNFNYYRIKDNNWCCDECYNKAEFTLLSNVDTISAEEIRDIISKKKNRGSATDQTSAINISDGAEGDFVFPSIENTIEIPDISTIGAISTTDKISAIGPQTNFSDAFSAIEETSSTETLFYLGEPSFTDKLYADTENESSLAEEKTKEKAESKDTAKSEKTDISYYEDDDFVYHGSKPKKDNTLIGKFTELLRQMASKNESDSESTSHSNSVFDNIIKNITNEKKATEQKSEITKPKADSFNKNTQDKTESKFKIPKDLKQILVISAVIISILIVLAIIFSLEYTTESTVDEEHTIELDYQDEENIAVLEENIGYDYGFDIYKWIKKTGAIEHGRKISENDIVKHEYGDYEIDTGIKLRVIIEETGFYLYTYDKIFDEIYAILLYDYNNISDHITLSEKEFDEIKASQRKYTVTSTIQITTVAGNNNSSYTPYFTFTVTNVSKKSIQNIYFEVIDSKNGKILTYSTTYQDATNIDPYDIRSYTVKEQGWSYNQEITLTQIIVYFTDSTTVTLDKYDFQFLDALYNIK